MIRPVSSTRTALLALIAIGLAVLLLAACVVEPAPTPNVEQLAEALAKTWATQTAQAASTAGPATLGPTPAGATAPPATPISLTTAMPSPSGTPAGGPVSTPTITPSGVQTGTPTVRPTLTPSSVPTASTTSGPTPTPSVTATPGCSIPIDAELAPMWDRAALGCPGMKAKVIAATWQRFEHGYMLWKGDQDRSYVLGFADGTDPWKGSVIADNPSWRWDRISFPNGRGLTPPAGLLEPTGNLGFIWYTYLGGPSSQLGWAVEPAHELCVTMQPSAGGLVAKTYPRACPEVQKQSLEPVFIAVQTDGTWRRRPEAPAPTATPTSLPPCAIATDPRLAPAWQRRELGCPKSGASVIWAAWQPFEGGSMFWRSDKDWTYVLDFAGGTDATRGAWATGGDNWRWDGSFPDGRGLTPPAGRYEPVRGFGFTWFAKLGGSSSQLGWATEPEKGICATLQPFEAGLIVASNSEVESCQNGNFNRAREPGFTPIVLALKDDGSWRRR